MNVSMVMASVSRNAGGLFPVARRLAQELSREASLKVNVVGLNDEFVAEDRALWQPASLSVCEPEGPKILGYSSGFERLLEEQSPDLIHQHGIWTLHARSVTRVNKRKGTPYVVSLHGMIEPWALKNGRLKKRLAWFGYQRENLERAAALLVPSEAEAGYVRDLGIRTPLAVIANGVDPVVRGDVEPAFVGHVPRGAKVVLFLGRLHPKKGLTELLQGFAEVRRTEPQLAEGWSLVIAGWDDGGHGQALRSLARDLHLSESHVCFTGPIFGAVRDATICESHAFILPSFGEGMPMAALEALSAGVPALLSPECNLGEVFAERAGLSVEASERGVARGLAEFFRLSNAEREQMGRQGRALAAERFGWSGITREVRRLYAWCLGEGERPDGVLS